MTKIVKWINKTDEFFIGYIPGTGKQTSSFLRKIILALGISVALLGVIIASSRQAFTSNTFEYGIPTTLEGTLFYNPIPHLRIPVDENNSQDSIYQTILLVGAGKHGALETLKRIEQKKNLSLDGKSVRLNGSLIYGEGKALLQLSDNSDLSMISAHIRKGMMRELGEVTLQGEIVDPKCYFGVMNPAEGKTHRSCAIRCISGGIPPVFHSEEKSDYFLLLGENLQPLNQEVLNIVGDNISLKGRIFEFDDWKILMINTRELHTLSASATNHRMIAAMETDMTLCGMN